MRLTEKLARALNRIFDRSPGAFPAFTIACNGASLTWSITDAVFTTAPVGGTAAPLSIPLSGYTIGSLVGYIASQAGYSVVLRAGPSSGLSALALFDQSGSSGQLGGNVVSAASNPTWLYLDAVAGELEVAQQQIAAMPAEMVTSTADGSWLDLLGSYYNVPRIPSAFYRSSVATYFDANGNMQAAPANVMRPLYVSGVDEGDLIEESAVNYLGANPTFNSITAPNTVAVSTALPAFLAGANIYAHTRNTGTTDTNCGGFVSEATATVSPCTASCWLYIPATYSGSLVQLAGFGTANANMTLRNQWQQVTWTNAAGGTMNIVLRLTGNTGDTVYSTCWQLEEGGVPTSYIPGASRAADTIAPIEADAQYGPRIIAEVIRPKSNNKAIEAAIRAIIGQPATVTNVVVYGPAAITYNGLIDHDGTHTYDSAGSGGAQYGLFDVITAFDLLGYADLPTFQANITALIDRLRAAGTQMRSLTLTGSTISDTLTRPTDATTMVGQETIADTLTAPSDASSMALACAWTDPLTQPTDATDTLTLSSTATYSGNRTYSSSITYSSGSPVTETIEG